MTVPHDARFLCLWGGGECSLVCTWESCIRMCVLLGYCSFTRVCGSVCPDIPRLAGQPRGGCHGPVLLFSGAQYCVCSMWSLFWPHLPSLPVPSHSSRHLTRTPVWWWVRMTPKHGLQRQWSRVPFPTEKGGQPLPALLALPLQREVPSVRCFFYFAPCF